MSLCYQPVSLKPVLAMTEALDRQDYALVLSDLNAIVTVIEGQMCDLICFSDPRKNSVGKLWAEALGTIDALLAMIKSAMISLAGRETISGHVPLTTKRKLPLPAIRFVNSTRLTFEDLRSCLEANFTALKWKQNTFRSAAGRHSIQSTNQMSRRPLSQLVIEAMLRTKEPVGEFNYQSVHNWLCTPLLAR
ncbi:MAG: hypothetical protein Q9180_005406 [Flavoplaca navasiana]